MIDAGQKDPTSGGAVIDAVLLDLDGTLVDSVYEHVRAWKLAFQRVGLDVPGARIHRAIGMGGDQLVAEVAGEAAERTVGDAVRKLHDELFWEEMQEVRALPGAGDLLRAVHQAGLTMVLASSSPADQVDRMLEVVDDAHLIDHLTTGDDADASKPAPDIIAVAAEKAGTSRAVVVGDAVWDIESARRAGLPCIALRSGGIGEDELRAAGAVDVALGPGDLAERLQEVLASVRAPG